MAEAEEEITVTGTNQFSIAGFISRISDRGLARTNKFRVIFTPPYAGGESEDYRQISLNCESAEIPGRDLTTSDTRIYGPSFKTPYMTSYNDISFTFLCDAALVEKRVFDEWLSMVNPRNTFDFEYRDSYTSTVVIEQLADNQLTTYSCRLIDAYPIQVNAIPVNWSDDNFQRVTISMTYRYWLENGATLEEVDKDIQETANIGDNLVRLRERQRELRNSQQTNLRNDLTDLRKQRLKGRTAFRDSLKDRRLIIKDPFPPPIVTPEPNLPNTVTIESGPPPNF